MTERRWATALSRASTELTVMFCTRTLDFVVTSKISAFTGTEIRCRRMYPYGVLVITWNFKKFKERLNVARRTVRRDKSYPSKLLLSLCTSSCG